jgi:hypothetical protein
MLRFSTETHNFEVIRKNTLKWQNSKFVSKFLPPPPNKKQIAVAHMIPVDKTEDYAIK